MKKPTYDVIGYWSEVKLDIIRRYATEYSKIINPNEHIRKHIYVDAFAGAGQHISALSVDWNVIQTAGKMRSIEIFYNFMIMDANMNVLWRNPDKVPEDQLTRMDKVWGDRSWRGAAYTTAPGLFGEMEEKADNQAIAEAFRMRFKKMAGFKYVPEPMPMRNEKGAVVYYLFFASQNETGANIVEYIFEKYRKRGLR